MATNRDRRDENTSGGRRAQDVKEMPPSPCCKRSTNTRERRRKPAPHPDDGRSARRSRSPQRQEARGIFGGPGRQRSRRSKLRRERKNPLASPAELAGTPDSRFKDLQMGVKTVCPSF